jgi:2-pyrone-4,6-dicarboxylate lactonase
MHTLTVTTPGPDRNARRPQITLPAGSCDSHVHIFGPHSRFPYAPDRTFTPEDVPLEELQSLHAFLGFDRAVIVQSACHGSDHSVVLDALERGGGRYRGVALIGPGTSSADIQKWHDAGMRGARIHFASHLGQPPSRDEISRIVDLIGPFNWHLAVHVTGPALLDFSERVADIPLRIVFDHMGRFDISEGREQPERRVLKELLAGDNVWVKLSGADRISNKTPGLEDSIELARELFQSRPDRCVWGTDFPHPNTHGFMPNDGDLVNTLARITDTPAGLDQLLVTNPTHCFDFASNEVP